MDRDWRRLRVGIIATDVVGILTAYVVSAALRFSIPALLRNPTMLTACIVLGSGGFLVTLAIALQQGAYRRQALMGGHRVYPLLVTASVYGTVSMIVLSHFVGDPLPASRGWLVGCWSGSILALILSRLMWRRVAFRWRKGGALVRRILIAGANQQGIAVAQQLHDPMRHGTVVVGFLDDYQRPGTEVLPGLAIVGHPNAAHAKATELRADEVVIILGGLAWESQRQLAELVTRPDSPVEGRISATFYDLLTTSAELSHVAYVPMLSMNRNRLSRFNAMCKRMLDQSAAAAMLLALTPLFLYWRIKAWAGRSPMFEHQHVLGTCGRSFPLAGLRPGLTESPVLARLPALWNVLSQDLSLVGPRPIRMEELPAHEQWRANLIALRPGLTGLWRLRKANDGVEERVALDLYYVRNCTFTLDLQILFQTSRELIRRSMGRRSLLARWKANEGMEAVVLGGESRIPNAARWEEDFEGVPAEAAGEGRR
jgi:lipopolysaccharide/colanic/teichoic acid biosynthesis glycosyltransferase